MKAWWRGLTIGARTVLIGIAALAIIFLGLYAHDQIHNHTPQGRYELCIQRKDAQAHEAGVSLSGALLAQVGITVNAHGREFLTAYPEGTRGTPGAWVRRMVG